MTSFATHSKIPVKLPSELLLAVLQTYLRFVVSFPFCVKDPFYLTLTQDKIYLSGD